MSRKLSEAQLEGLGTIDRGWMPATNTVRSLQRLGLVTDDMKLTHDGHVALQGYEPWHVVPELEPVQADEPRTLEVDDTPLYSEGGGVDLETWHERHSEPISGEDGPADSNGYNSPDDPEVDLYGSPLDLETLASKPISAPTPTVASLTATLSGTGFSLEVRGGEVVIGARTHDAMCEVEEALESAGITYTIRSLDSPARLSARRTLSVSTAIAIPAAEPRKSFTLACVDCSTPITYSAGNAPGEPLCPPCVTRRYHPYSVSH